MATPILLRLYAGGVERIGNRAKALSFASQLKDALDDRCGAWAGLKIAIGELPVATRHFTSRVTSISRFGPAVLVEPFNNEPVLELGEDQARSLVRDLTGDEPEPCGKEQVSKYEPVAEQWKEISEDEAIFLSGLSKSDLQNIRDLLCSRFGKENVIVRSTKQEEGHWVEQPDGNWMWEKEDVMFKELVRTGEGDQYLRD